MILAAGRGLRMRPLTDQTPKPMLSVAGKPLIQHHLERLAQSGYQKVIINHAWLGEKICAFIGNGNKFKLEVGYSAESPALETAGGIVKAMPQLMADNPSKTFTVVNGDVFCDFDFDNLPTSLGANLAHLVMVSNPAHHPNGDFAISNGQLTTDGEEKLTFSGIAVYHSAFFAGLDAKIQPLRPVFDESISNNQLAGQKYTGTWCDVGTPERLQLLNETENKKGL
jgi:MurNAc alpha-1-phosphate uridylyltransferase